ncbi:MAG: Mg-protoporphyrin monomethyl ester oxidative cyclase [Gammaproteobacteria bacterium]|nr:Mg-protoporphyrin monomethyl ester oxidative cyclase [Gammaproteobacteria bacterium]
MLSILVCHSYFLRFDRKQLERGKPYPPLATLQLAAMLRRAGHDVALFDAMVAEGLQDYDRTLEAVNPQLVILYEDTFNFLSKMCLGVMRKAACEMISAARRSGCRVMVAGPDVTDAPGPYLRAGADLALMGEGLATLLEVLPRLDSRPHAATDELVEGLPGIAYLNSREVTRVKDASVLAVPHYEGFAAWDLVDMERYRSAWMTAHGYFSLNMVSSRGCSFRCSWCAKPTWGNQYLQRKPGQVASEMAHLKRSYDPDHVWFADDIFGFRADWVAEFTAAVHAADAAIPFTIQTRADLVGERMAAALQGAGCREAWIGAESGSQRVLDAMNKGTTVHEILTARERLKSAGIRVGFFIQLGYMDEQLADIVATRELLAAARPDDIGVSVSYPLPGTRFYELVKAQLGKKTHWQDSSDLEMMFQGTYSSDFYRAVRNLLHEETSLHHSEAWATSGGRPGGGPAAAMRALEARWQALFDTESRYRSAPPAAAAN